MDSKRALKNTKINKQNKNKISFIFSFFLFIYSLYCCTCVFIQRKNKIIIENGIRIYYQHKLKYSIQIKYPKTVSSRKRCNKNFFFPNPRRPFELDFFTFSSFSFCCFFRSLLFSQYRSLLLLLLLWLLSFLYRFYYFFSFFTNS